MRSLFIIYLHISINSSSSPQINSSQLFTNHSFLNNWWISFYPYIVFIVVVCVFNKSKNLLIYFFSLFASIYNSFDFYIASFNPITVPYYTSSIPIILFFIVYTNLSWFATVFLKSLLPASTNFVYVYWVLQNLFRLSIIFVM